MVHHAVLVGAVTDVAGRPMPNAQLTFARGDTERLLAQAGEDGRYQLRVTTAKEPGSLSASYGLIQATESGLVLQPGDRRTVDLRLDFPASVSGRVTDADGRPLAGVVVELRPTAETSARPGSTSDDAATASVPASASASVAASASLASRSPAQSVAVTASIGGASTFTRGDGVFRFRRVDAGRYHLQAWSGN